MPQHPLTSVSLLKAISNDAESVRWAEFVSKYDKPMRAFLQSRYPSVEADDVMQNTFVALLNCLPRYRYLPDEHGHFHNYLMGIVKHKAEDALRGQAAQSAIKTALAQESESAAKDDPFRQAKERAAEEAWQNSVKETALEQLLADDSIASSTREIFRHVAIMHEKPADVARKFGVSRNNVDQIKVRMIARLKDLVAGMYAATS